MTLTRFAYNGKRCPTSHSKYKIWDRLYGEDTNVYVELRGPCLVTDVFSTSPWEWWWLHRYCFYRYPGQQQAHQWGVQSSGIFQMSSEKQLEHMTELPLIWQIKLCRLEKRWHKIHCLNEWKITVFSRCVLARFSFLSVVHSPSVQLKDLLNTYYPIEIDSKRTAEEKLPLMVEWWVTALSEPITALLDQEGITLLSNWPIPSVLHQTWAFPCSLVYPMSPTVILPRFWLLTPF